MFGFPNPCLTLSIKPIPLSLSSSFISFTAVSLAQWNLLFTSLTVNYMYAHPHSSIFKIHYLALLSLIKRLFYQGYTQIPYLLVEHIWFLTFLNLSLRIDELLRFHSYFKFRQLPEKPEFNCSLNWHSIFIPWISTTFHNNRLILEIMKLPNKYMLHR